jgi:ABC-type dipeptide/oligopeptide/nickel transport system ATPase component
VLLEGDVPNPIDPPPGCHFHPRCPNAVIGTCDVIEPPLVEVLPGRRGACHNPLESFGATPAPQRESDPTAALG